MASPTITHETHSCLITVLAAKRSAVFDKVWAEGGRNFTPEEEWTLDLASQVLIGCEPTNLSEAGAVLETAIEQLQLFNHGDLDIDPDAVELALFKVFSVVAREGGYRRAIFSSPEGSIAP